MRATAAILVGLALQGLSATSWAEESSAESAPPPKQGPPAAAAASDRFAQDWWRSTQQELFAGIELSAEQQQRIAALLAEAAGDRARARELIAEVERARLEKDEERLSRAQTELRRLRPQLSPEWRVEAMGELLTEEQRVVFDRLRRLRSDRRLAEQRQRRESSRRRQPRRDGPGLADAPRGAAPEPLPATGDRR